MKAGRVLVTRPEPGAAATAAHLRAIGFEPIVLPLTTIEPLQPMIPPDLSRIGVVAATSANAFRHAGPELLAALAGRRGYAVGARTCEAGLSVGLDMAAQPPGTAAELAGQIVAGEAAGTRLLYLCGRVRRPDFTLRLRHAGILVDEMETYDTLPVAREAAQAAALLAWNPLRAALVYSSMGARQLDRLALHPELNAFFADTLFFCLSERTAMGLNHVDAARMRIATEPSEEAMIGLLRKWC